MTAIGMCLENELPILVFNFKKEGNIERAIAGEPIGTWVSNTAPADPRADRGPPATHFRLSPPLGQTGPGPSVGDVRLVGVPGGVAMSIEEILLEAEERMEKSIALLDGPVAGVRTGRANTGLVDSIRVEYYGSPTPLKQMANLSTPEPQQILIRPFDPSVIGDIVKAIQASDLGLTPNSDNKVVRLNVPVALGRAAQEAGRPRQGPGRGGPRLHPQHPPRRQQAGRPGAGRQGPDRGRPGDAARKRSRP